MILRRRRIPSLCAFIMCLFGEYRRRITACCSHSSAASPCFSLPRPWRYTMAISRMASALPARAESSSQLAASGSLPASEHSIPWTHMAPASPREASSDTHAMNARRSSSARCTALSPPPRARRTRGGDTRDGKRGGSEDETGTALDDRRTGRARKMTAALGNALDPCIPLPRRSRLERQRVRLVLLILVMRYAKFMRLFARRSTVGCTMGISRLSLFFCLCWPRHRMHSYPPPTPSCAACFPPVPRHSRVVPSIQGSGGG